MTLRTFSRPVKILFSVFLLTIGLGYLSAIAYLFLIDVEPHREVGIGLVQGVINKYYGQRGVTKLESAITGAMGADLRDSEKARLLDWIRGGADRPGYDAVRPLFEAHCLGCHSPESGMGIGSLVTYEDVSAYTTTDLGQSVRSLVRVSHIHLFGMSFIFLLTSGIFVFSDIRPVWKSVLVAVPFISIWLDIGSWWFTKIEPLFAYTVIIGGAVMGASLAVQILVSLYEMWFRRSSPDP